jgi:molybdate transport system regulatory protein
MRIYQNGRITGMKIKSKLWIEAGGRPVFGSGKGRLLEAIDRCGSINQAAKETNMSYRRVWAQLNTMEDRLGIKLVERHTGGRGGGGATLTEDARKILKKYLELERGLQKVVDERFKKIFEKDTL